MHEDDSLLIPPQLEHSEFVTHCDQTGHGAALQDTFLIRYRKPLLPVRI